jgi:membrane protein implicated in regulation of membrane protease activity
VAVTVVVVLGALLLVLRRLIGDARLALLARICFLFVKLSLLSLKIRLKMIVARLTSGILSRVRRLLTRRSRNTHRKPGDPAVVRPVMKRPRVNELVTPPPREPVTSADARELRREELGAC